MAKQPIKVMSSEVRSIDGRNFVVFTGRDSIGRAVEMMFPADSLDAVYEDTRTRLEALSNAGDANIAGGWERSFSRPGIPARLGATDRDEIMLIVRAGSPTEARITFNRDDALALAKEMHETAERLPAQPPRTQ